MRLRFILAMAVVVVIAILCVVVFFRLDAANQLENYFYRGGMYGLTGVVTTLEKYYQTNGSWQGVDQVVMSAWQTGMNGRGFRRGQGMAGSMPQLELISTEDILIYDSSGNPSGGQVGQDLINQSIVLQNSRSQTIGYLWVAGGSALQPSSQQPLIQMLNSAALTAGLVAIAVGLILALVLASGLIRPIRKLTNAAQTMASGDLSQRVEISGKDEIAVLGDSFNRMAQSLESSEQNRRAMTADVAHELRTPLAIQRAQVEAMLDGVYPLDEDNLGSLLIQNELLTRLVEDLRTLALADSGELKLDLTRLELFEWTRRIAERFKPALEGRSLEVTANQQEVYVEADPIRIEQILNNLLSNAIRHTPEDGKITISIGKANKQAIIEVHDSGEGIPPQAINRVFERFYRADSSRTHQNGSTGLGLAIARQLALIHGGNLTAANHPQGGAVFTLTLPLIS